MGGGGSGGLQCQDNGFLRMMIPQGVASYIARDAVHRAGEEAKILHNGVGLCQLFFRSP